MKTKFNGILTLLIALVVQVSFAQNRTISGVVSDETGPLPGVSVLKKGTSQGTETDFDGKYNIKAKTGDILVFSFVGMETVEKTVRGTSKINVAMQSGNVLDEIVVVAYGTAKKSSVVGSVASLNKQVLENTKATNVSKALEGAISGVQVVSSSGQPGESAKIKIRGVGSINSLNDPLYVVDGIPFDGEINSISQSDIKSINVLKDAAANSLYGSRGANGVIIIETKKGKEGKIRVNIEGSTGISDRSVKEYDIITDPKQYYEVYWRGLKQKYIADGKTDTEASALASKNIIQGKDFLQYNAYNVPNDKLVGSNGKLNPNAKLLYTDSWNDEFFKPGIRKDINFNVSGGNEKSTYYFSAGYLDDQGYVVNSNFKRYNTRLNINHDITEKLNVNASILYANTITNFPTSSGNAYTNSFQWARDIAPIYPVYLYKNGVIQYDDEGNKLYDFGQNGKLLRPYGSNVNPIAQNKFDINKTNRDNINLNLSASYEILENLQLKYNFSNQLVNRNKNDWQNSKYGYGTASNGSGTRTSSRQLETTHQQFINWSKSINEFNVEVLLGHELYQLKYNELKGTKEKFLLFDKPEFGLAAVTKNLNSFQRDYSVEGYLSRVKLNYAEKYFISGSYRRDASSVFHPDNRWGNFWSAGAGWLVHKEDFMKNLTWFNSLKLKASYGTQGNDAILYPDSTTRRNYYAYADQYKVNGNSSGELVSVLAYSGNKDLTWEKSKAFNIGFESKLLDRVTFNFDYFKRTTSDLLFSFRKTASLGIPEVPKNIGSMENYGYEFELGVDVIKNDDFRWNIAINGTKVENEVTELAPEFDNGITRGTKKISVGNSIYGFYLAQWAGVNPKNGNPQYYIEEKDATGKKTGKRVKTENYSKAVQNKAYVGDALPDLYGGVISTLNYKGFDLGVQLSYQIGGDIYDSTYAGLLHSNSGGRNWSKDILNSWTPENKNTDIPIFQLDKKDINERSSRFLYDASYLSLKNITLGYSLPNSITSKLNINKVRLYVSGDNLKLWSERQGLDPRQYSNGTTGDNYSPLRTISAGFNIQL